MELVGATLAGAGVERGESDLLVLVKCFTVSVGILGVLWCPSRR